MDAHTIHVREGDVGLIEDQRQVRAGQDDSLNRITPDKGLSEAGKALAFRVPAGARRCESKVGFVNIVELIGVRPSALCGSIVLLQKHLASEVRGVGEPVKRSFSKSVEDAVRASRFAAACVGRAITVEFRFSLREQLGTERVSFAYPNRFTIFALAKVVQGLNL